MTQQKPPDGPILGIDISKLSLEVAISSHGPNHIFDNHPKGIQKLIKFASKQQASLIVFEPTGGYERELANQLARTKLKFAMVDAARARHFIKASGTIAKTDKIDARMLAKFGEVMRPKPTTPPTKAEAELHALVTLRDQLVSDLTVQKGRIDSASPVAHRIINKTTKFLTQQIKAVEAQIREALEQCTETKRKVELLTSVPSVGFVTATSLIAFLREIGTISRNKIAALAGLAPHPNASGKVIHRPSIRGGRPSIRKTLYMASLSAISYNPPLKALYQRLCAAGKPGKVALVAVARKLLTMLNSIIRTGKPWQNPAPLTA